MCLCLRCPVLFPGWWMTVDPTFKGKVVKGPTPEKKKLPSDSCSCLSSFLSPQMYLLFMQMKTLPQTSRPAYFTPLFESTFKRYSSAALEVIWFTRWVTKHPIKTKLHWEVGILQSPWHDEWLEYRIFNCAVQVRPSERLWHRLPAKNHQLLKISGKNQW